MKIYPCILLFILSALLSAQPYEVTVDQIPDWNGWEAIVVQNGLITTATVPAIGARVMQYDLGEHQSIFHDHSFDGYTSTPKSNSNWINFGGFKNWPSPQYGPGRWSWPPPPTLDFGLYDQDIVTNTPDSAVIRVTSPIEQWKAPDMQFVREMTIFRNSSRVRMKQILINKGTGIQNWGIWDITQCLINHTGERDYSNFWMYFPINPESGFGPEGVSFQQSSQAWTGEIAPGIYGVKAVPNSQKLFSDPHKGWICYVDEREGVAYAKTFPVYEEAEYPDDGARVALYMGGNYVEVEVTGPVEDIPPQSGQIHFTIDWWAAKVTGPILNVNSMGAVNQYLSLDDGVLSGNYGVFHAAKAKIVFLNSEGQVLGTGQEMDVTPLENLEYSEHIVVPENTDRLELQVYTSEGTLLGILDESTLENLTGIEKSHPGLPDAFLLAQNTPNPFNPMTEIRFDLRNAGQVSVSVYDIHGRQIRSLANGYYPAGTHRLIWDGRHDRGHDAPAGLYFYRLRLTGGHQESELMTRKMLLIR